MCYVNCFNSQKLNQNKKISLLKASKVDNLLLKERSVFPRGDELDKRIFTLALPAVLNFALLPLVGAVDTFWIGRMKNALALAGQGAANQVFSSTFWIISFLPSVVTPLVAKSYGAGNQDEVKKNVGEALFIGMFMGAIGMTLLSIFPSKALNVVLPIEAKAREFALPYLKIRALTFLPALLSTVAFSAFRGTMDVFTPLKIAIISNAVNMIMDPILIFKYGLGTVGAAAATCVSEVVAFLLYFKLLFQKKLVNWNNIKMPTFKSLTPLLISGLGVQMRAIAMNIAFLAVTRTTQALDTAGTAAAAHAITLQLWQLGGVFLLAMSTVASILVPTEIAKSKKEGRDLTTAKYIADRILSWGVILGIILGFLQLMCLPLLNTFSPLPEVQQAAKLPSVVGAALQLINGVVFIGEGIQQGNQYFAKLAITTAFATAGMLTSLKLIGNSLAGVWASFAVFNIIRLSGVLYHHFIDGPLAPKKLKMNNNNK